MDITDIQLAMASASLFKSMQSLGKSSRSSGEEMLILTHDSDCLILSRLVNVVHPPFYSALPARHTASFIPLLDTVRLRRSSGIPHSPTYPSRLPLHYRLLLRPPRRTDADTHGVQRPPPVLSPSPLYPYEPQKHCITP